MTAQGGSSLSATVICRSQALRRQDRSLSFDGALNRAYLPPVGQGITPDHISGVEVVDAKCPTLIVSVLKNWGGWYPQKDLGLPRNRSYYMYCGRAFKRGINHRQ